MKAESPTVVAFRALVMLACLVAAPLAAIFGSAFPEVVRAWLINPLLGRDASSAAAQDHAAPGLLTAVSQVPFAAGLGAPTSGEPSSSDPNLSGQAAIAHPPGAAWARTAASWSTPDRAAGSPPPLAAPTGPIARGAAAANSQASDFGAPAPNPAPSVLPVGGPLAALNPVAYGAPANGSPQLSANPPSANQTAYSTPAPASPLSGAAEAPQRLPASLETAYSPEATARSGSGAAPSALQPGAENEQFAWFEKKLREYGASYYLLETWGSEGELYRFHCKMAVASNPNYTRHFEAMDRDKLQAMARVLEQVEAWRSGRLP